MKNVLEYLENAANMFPDKVVFADEVNQITYSELRQKARNIASSISEIVDGKTGKPIVIYIDRSIDTLVAFFGVIYSGNFYVPIDSALPLNRKKAIIGTLDPVLIISLEQNCMDTEKNKVYLMDLVTGMENGAVLDEIARKQIDTDPLYAIFTSGSTGIPKGVLVCHRSVIDLIEQFANEFAFIADDIWGNQAPFDFDVSVKDIYMTIKNGGTMYIIPKKYFAMPKQLIEYLNENRVTVIIWATSALMIVANLKTFDKIIPENLRIVMFSGEVMPVKTLNYWKKYLPTLKYVNLYGPTEITCNCTYYIVDRDFQDEEVIPIGKPFLNTDILVLDNERTHEVNEGEAGELCVRGSSLSLGYYNNFERTKESFIQNPLNVFYPEVIYCTGDLVKYNKEGQLIFISRKDFQIKHMGHRIELGEIEVLVNAMPFIENAVCVYTDEMIVLCYQADREYKREIIEKLKDSLPKYMWPNKYIRFEKLPMNSHSKVDRVQLKNELESKKE